MRLSLVTLLTLKFLKNKNFFLLISMNTNIFSPWIWSQTIHSVTANQTEFLWFLSCETVKSWCNLFPHINQRPWFFQHCLNSQLKRGSSDTSHLRSSDWKGQELHNLHFGYFKVSMLYRVNVDEWFFFPSNTLDI